MNAPRMPFNPLADMMVDDKPMTPQREKEIRDGCRNAWNQSRAFFGIYFDDSRLTPIERQVIGSLGKRLYGRG